MARIRSIHPGFFTDENLVVVSLPARLLFLGLGVEADDKGIFEWKPLTIKMRVFPADNVDIPSLLAELEGAGAVKQYHFEGRAYGAIRNFRKFQKPKTPNDIHPAPADIRNYVGLSGSISEAFPQNGENAPQMEEEGEGGKNPPLVPPSNSGSKGKHLLPADWELPNVADLPPKAKACAEQWSTSSYETHGEAFANYWRGRRGMNADWRLTWANRIVALHGQVMRDQKFGNAPPAKPNGAAYAPKTADELERAIALAVEKGWTSDEEKYRRQLAEIRADVDPRVAAIAAGLAASLSPSRDPGRQGVG